MQSPWSKMTNKERWWLKGNIIVTRGDLSQEFYFIGDDLRAYPCNKKVDKWNPALEKDNYDDDLKSVYQAFAPEANHYWDIVEVWTEIIQTLHRKSLWIDGNIIQTKGQLFYKCINKERAVEVNNGGGWLESADYDDDLFFDRHRESWNIWSIFQMSWKRNS